MTLSPLFSLSCSHSPARPPPAEGKKYLLPYIPIRTCVVTLVTLTLCPLFSLSYSHSPARGREKVSPPLYPYAYACGHMDSLSSIVLILSPAATRPPAGREKVSLPLCVRVWSHGLSLPYCLHPVSTATNQKSSKKSRKKRTCRANFLSPPAGRAKSIPSPIRGPVTDLAGGTNFFCRGGIEGTTRPPLRRRMRLNRYLSGY